MSRLGIGVVVAILANVLPGAWGQSQTNFSSPLELSTELSGGGSPGGSAIQGKLVRLVKTTGGARDGRLVSVYSDANHTESVWAPRDGTYLPRDVFARISTDGGASWSAPANLSRSASTYSSLVDLDADGALEPYWGDCEKPNVFAAGDILVVTWIGAYVPAPGWTFGASGYNSVQGTVTYPDLATYPISHQVPFRGVWAAISLDGGTSWTRGVANPPLQLTFGERDAKQDSVRGAGKRWLVTWQEDPEGLKLGSADGPGEGGSGAVANKGTDIWYTWTADIAANPLDLRLHRAPLSNQSEYDASNPGEAIHNFGPAGQLENHFATRANLHIVQDGTTWKAIVAYEESKGINDVLLGKTIQYHCFPFDQPQLSGPPEQLSGSAGTRLTDLIPNSKRVRFVRQTPNGIDPALFIFWREGIEDEGGPSDVRGKLSLSLDPAAVAAAPTLNFSTNTPTAGPGDLLLGTQVNPIEDSNAHRAILRGSFVALGWCYTWNGPLARYTDLANYNFYVRRSFDGGASWDTPRNISNITDTRITVREPRLVQAATTGVEDGDVFVAAWGTVTNVYEGIGVSEPLDIQFTRTSDRGATWEKIVNLAGAVDDLDYGSQLAVDDPGTAVFLVYQRSGAGGSSETVFTRGTVEHLPATVGTIFCLGDGTGAACPCDNRSARDTGEGCRNSSGRGALLVASGSASVSANDLQLVVHGLPVPSTAILGCSGAPMYGSFGLPFREGLFCLAGNKVRLAAGAPDALGTLDFGVGLPTLPLVQPGRTLNLQVIYRDPLGLCSFLDMNTSNALRVELLP